MRTNSRGKRGAGKADSEIQQLKTLLSEVVETLPESTPSVAKLRSVLSPAKLRELIQTTHQKV